MLWRKSYSTRIVRAFVPLVPIAGIGLDGDRFNSSEWDCVLLGFGEESLVKQEIWRRLLESEFGPEFPVAQFVFNIKSVVEIQGIVPPSRRHLTFIGDLVDWPLDDDVAAWAQKPGLLMVGQPTEDAWEEFATAVRGSITA